MPEIIAHRSAMTAEVASADPFALARADHDAELLESIAEFERLQTAAKDRLRTEEGEDEGARILNLARPVRDRIEKYRPVTLRGVLAALDFASNEHDDPDYWPEGAVEGLRALVCGDATGRNPGADAALIAAERKFHELESRVNALNAADSDQAAVDPAFLRWMSAREQIARTAPASLAGCAAKLRVLLDHEIGIETHALSEDDTASLRQILAFVEREADRGAA